MLVKTTLIRHHERRLAIGRSTWRGSSGYNTIRFRRDVGGGGGWIRSKWLKCVCLCNMVDAWGMIYVCVKNLKIMIIQWLVCNVCTLWRCRKLTFDFNSVAVILLCDTVSFRVVVYRIVDEHDNWFRCGSFRDEAWLFPFSYLLLY